MHLSPSFYLLALFLLVVDLGLLLLCVFLFSPLDFKRFSQLLLLRTLVCVCLILMKVLAAATSRDTCVCVGVFLMKVLAAVCNVHAQPIIRMLPSSTSHAANVYAYIHTYM
jgi:hypothetical protein